MIRYDLYQLLKDELSFGSNNLVTRPSGQAVRERIERELEKLGPQEVVVLDFGRIAVIDYSCADEIIAKLVSRLLAGEYGDKYVVLDGLNENQRENIEVALERKDLAVMAGMRDGSRVLLGGLNNYLRETLEFIQQNRRASSRDLAEAKKIEPNTSGTRLLNLYKKRLVRRVEDQGNDGALWAYEAL